MDWSWDLLDAHERDLLTQLSVFAGGWTLQAAEGVCEVAGGAGLAGLQRALVSKSLVLADDHDGHTRYRMLETVRMYGQQKLLEAGATSQSRERHARYFCEAADAVSINDRFLNVADALAWERETDNIAAVVDWLRDEERLADAAALVTMSALVWRSGASSARFAPLIAGVLDTPLEDRDLGVVLLAAAELAWQEGKILNEMGERAHRAAGIGRQVGDDALASAALILEGITLQARQPELAEKVLVEAAELGERCGDVRMAASAYAQASGYESLGRGRHAEARALIDRARSLASSDGWERIHLETMGCAAEIMAGNWSAAESARREYHRTMVETGEQLTWFNAIDESVLAIELGSPGDQPLTEAARELRAAGGNGDRPELLMIPLAAACLDKDWTRAARSISAIRSAGRSGLTFGSVPATALYLQFRSQIPPEILDAAADESLVDVIAAELEHEAAGT